MWEQVSDLLKEVENDKNLETIEGGMRLVHKAYTSEACYIPVGEAMRSGQYQGIQTYLSVGLNN